MNKYFFIVSTVSILLAGCSNHDEEVKMCVELGVTYFKEIGSYPTLTAEPNTGRLARTVARERCKRTTTAFPAD